MKRIFLTKPIETHRNKLARNAGLLLAGALLAGCPAANRAPETATSNGKVVIRGSNTIGEELAPRLITEFKKDHAGVDFDLETKATGYGLAALRAGKCDIAAASRPPTPDELSEAKNLQVELVEQSIGSYAVAVVVHPKNPIATLTQAQVRDIFTGAVQNWKDVGGSDAAIQLYVRDPISGTYLGFKELAMDNKAYAAGRKLCPSYAAIAQAVAGDENGIGYTGIELPKGASIKAVTIGGVAPTAASVNDGKYPYARALHFYTNKSHETDSAREFVQYALSSKGQEVLAELGFVPHP